MAKLGRRKPCRECPYRTTAVPGYVGDDHPIPFVDKTYRGDVDMPCHMDIDYSDPEWRETQLPTADMCAGALIMMRNDLKTPRDPRMAEAVRGVERSDQVFAGPREFLAYHMDDERYLDPMFTQKALVESWKHDVRETTD